MTKEEKITLLSNMLKPEVVDLEELDTLLTITKYAILNRRYPYGYDEAKEVPSQYDGLQLQCCVALFNKKGAEGQTAHKENGIDRTYEAGDIPESLLKQVVPLVGSVNTNA